MTPIAPTAVGNGTRLSVDFPFFTGTVRVRLTDSGGEFSCFGEVPYQDTNVSGHVDNRPAQVVVVRQSTVEITMLVARFRYLKEDVT